MAEKSSERYDTGYILHQLCRAGRILDLTGREFQVLTAMVAHDCPDEDGNRKGEVWCSPKNGLADLTGIISRTIQRTLLTLEEKGAITNLTPGNAGGKSRPNTWRINYEKLGWKDTSDKGRHNVPKVDLTPQRAALGRPNLDQESGPESDPPQNSSPLSQSHPLTQPQTEEEDFPFLNPEERSLLQDLQLSRAGWRMVDDAAPELLTQALQHIESSRTEIEGAGFSGEQRFGAILNGSYVLPKEPEPEPANGNGRKRYFCSFCGSVYSEEGHECTEG